MTEDDDLLTPDVLAVRSLYDEIHALELLDDDELHDHIESLHETAGWALQRVLDTRKTEDGIEADAERETTYFQALAVMVGLYEPTDFV